MNNESGAVDFEIDIPCPLCNGKLVSIRNKDGTPFLGVTDYLVFCKVCEFEEDAKQWKERIDNAKV